MIKTLYKYLMQYSSRVNHIKIVNKDASIKYNMYTSIIF